MGKKKYIQTPEKMWEYFQEYKKEVKANPIETVEQRRSSVNIQITKGADVSGLQEEIRDANKAIVSLPKERPLTMEGFQNWLDDNDIITDVTDYFENKDNRYADYIRICSRVKRNIRQDQIDGGMCGIYNPSITQRLNGLSDNKNINVTAEQPLFNEPTE